MSDVLDRLKTALADRYTIEREIGSGGMATVYLAEDLKHHRQVAIKVLRPDLAATLGPERFLREIEIAAKLQHPHILPLLDSGEADSFLYYVMPFVEGQSLRDKLAKEGELPIGDAVRILRDVVDALTEAHAHGVVHRDIKPENILLRGRHALVTDFGVAKAVSEATGREKLTTAGVALGTPAYMAPEQAAADPHLDHRVDIYAVGAVAYELLTGRPVFMGTTPQMILSAHVTETPEPVTKHRDTVPTALESVVMRCLEKKPADRFQSAEELLPQLEALTTPSGGVTPTDTQPLTATRARRRWLLPGVLAVAVAVVVGSYFTFRLMQVGAPGTLIGDAVLAEDDVILVVEFQNHTDDSLLAATVTDAIRVELQQSPVVQVQSRQAMFDGLRRMGLEPGQELSDSLARDLTERANAKAYVTGDVRRLGSSYQLTARVVSAADGSEVLTKRVTAEDEAHLVEAVEDISKQLRRGIGESLRAVQTAPPLARVTTASLPALRAFMAAGRAFDSGNESRAITLLQQAVDLDTAFASAWNFLAALYYNRDMYREGTEAVESAYSFRDRLSERERLFVMADYHKQRREFAQAEAAFVQLLEIDPGSSSITVYADLMLSRRRWPEAESLSLRAIELRDPQNGRSAVDYWNAAEAQVAQRRFGAADSLLTAMARNLPGHPYVVAQRNRLLWAQRDFAAVEAFLDSLETTEFSEEDVRYMRCWSALARGRVAEWRGCGFVDITAAFCELHYSGDTARAAVMIDSLLHSDAPPYAAIIAVLAEMGRLADAHRVLQQWRDISGPDDPEYRSDLGRATGSIALAEDQPDSAVKAFLAWNSADFAGATHIYNRGLAEAANAHDRAGRPDSAIALYERALALPNIHGGRYEAAWYPHALRRLGELHQSLGHREQAMEYYGKFVELWKDADPVLQPQVEAARRALAWLMGEAR